MQYDELTGQAVSAGKTSMIASGFEVGKNVELNAAAKGDKKNATDGDAQFRIAYINDDGSIGLNKINFDGLPMPDVVVVSFADAQAKYKPSRVPIEMMANYPGNVAHESDAWTEFLHQTIASTAMHTMLHEFGPPPIFMIQSKPVMRVRAINAFSKGALVVVSVCSRFTAPRGSGFEVVMSLNVPDNPRVALAPLQSESNVSPFFLHAQDDRHQPCQHAIVGYEGYGRCQLPSASGGRGRYPCCCQHRGYQTRRRACLASCSRSEESRRKGVWVRPCCRFHAHRFV